MIDAVLESKFKQIDLLYSLLSEEKNASAAERYEELRETSTSLYRKIEGEFRDPLIGLHLSPATLVKQRSVAYRNKVEATIAELRESGRTGDLESIAKRMVDEEIDTALHNRINEIMKENKGISGDEARSLALRDMSELVDIELIPKIDRLTVHSQGSGRSDVFTTGDWLGEQLSAIHQPVTYDTYHDPMISHMVRFGSDSPPPKRVEREAKRIESNIKDTKNSIEKWNKVLEVGDDEQKSKASDELADLENRLAIDQKNLAQISANGAWTPEDLNVLCYGESPPPPIESIEELARRKEEEGPIKVKGGAKGGGKDKGDGLFPSLYFRMFGSDEFGWPASGEKPQSGGVIDNMMRNLSSKAEQRDDVDAEKITKIINKIEAFLDSSETGTLGTLTVGAMKKQVNKIVPLEYQYISNKILSCVRGDAPTDKISGKVVKNIEAALKDIKPGTKDLTSTEKRLLSSLSVDVRNRVARFMGTMSADYRLRLLKLARMRDRWVEIGGDLTKAPYDLYVIAVQHIRDELVRIKGRLEKQKRTATSDEAKALQADINKIGRMVKEDTTDRGHEYYDLQVGDKIWRKRYSRGRGRWDDEPKTIANPYDRERDLSHKDLRYDVDLSADYNIRSLIKRIAVADKFMEAVDSSISEWVISKVGDSIYRLIDPNHRGMLNVGTDPGLVNKFLCDIDLMEERYGVDARMSWKLIGFIDTHTSRANVLLKKASDFFGDEDSIKDVSEFGNWRTGLLKQGTKDVPYKDPKTGRPIYVTGEGFDQYVHLAIAFASEQGKFDIDDDYNRSHEIDMLYVNADRIGQQIEELSKQTQVMGEDEKILVKISSLQRQRDEIESKIADLESSRNQEWASVIEFASELKNRGVRDIEALKKAMSERPSDLSESFEAWLETSGESERLDEIKSELEELSNSEDLTDEEIAEKSQELDKEYREEMARLRKEYSQKVKESDQESEPEIDADKRQAVSRVLRHYADYDNERVAKIASERSGEAIAADDVHIVRGKRPQNNMASFLLNSIRQRARSVAGDDPDSFSLEIRRLIKEDEAGQAFVDAMVESMIAMIERSLLESSQTRMHSGGGNKTLQAYEDYHGAEHLLPGYDIGESFGQRSNPIRMISLKKNQNNELREEIREKQKKLSSAQDILSGKREEGVREADWRVQQSDAKEKMATLEREIEEHKKQIEENKFDIEEYKRVMDEHPAIKRMAQRAESIALGANPYHPKNKAVFEALLDKMKRKAAGEDVEISEGQYCLFNSDGSVIQSADLREELKAQAAEIEGSYIERTNEKEMIRFMHRHTPLLQSMSVVGSRVAGRLMVKEKRSLEMHDVDGEPPSNQKEISDLGAAEEANQIRDMMAYIHAGRQMNVMYEEIKESGIGGKLREKGMPDRALLDLSMQLAFWANGPVMKNGITTSGGRDLSRQKMKRTLLNYFVDYGEVEPLMESLIDRASELAKPDEEEIEATRTLYNNTMVYFNEMMAGSHILTESGDMLPYSSSELEVMIDFLDAIQSMKETGDESGIAEKTKKFLDFAQSLESEKDKNEVFAEVTRDLAYVDRIDNLIYMITKRQNLAGAASRAEDDETHDSIQEQLSELDIKIEEQMLELKEKGVYLSDVLDMEDLLVTLSNARRERIDRVKVLIDRYKDDDPDVAAKLEEFKSLVIASERYHDARSKLDVATSEEEKEAARREISKQESILNTARRSLQFEFGERAEELSEAYLERIKIYDKLIRERNAIIGKIHTNRVEAEETFKSIINTIVSMTKKYNEDGDELSSELVDRYVSARQAVKRAKEKISGKMEVRALVQLPEIEERINVKIYPDSQYKKSFDALRTMGIPMRATLMEPTDLFGEEEGKSVMVLDGVELPKEIEQQVEKHIRAVGPGNEVVEINEQPVRISRLIELLRRTENLPGLEVSVISREKTGIGRAEGLEKTEVLVTVI